MSFGGVFAENRGLVGIDSYIVETVWNNVNQVFNHVTVNEVNKRPSEINDRPS